MMKDLPEITVGVLNAPYIFEINADENGVVKPGGFEGRFLDSVLAALGFKYKMLEPNDHEWGRLQSSGNWSGLIGMLHNGKADIAISTLSVTEERMEVVDFSSSYALEETTFALKKTGMNPTLAYLLYPFDAFVWMSLVGAIIYLSVILLFLLGKKRSFGNIILQLISNVLKQPLQLGNEMQKFKFLFSIWLCFASVISLWYSAALLSFLTIPILDVPVQNFQELSQAVQMGSHQCFVLKGTSTIPFLLTSKEEYLVKLGEIIEHNKWHYNISQMSKGNHISDKIVHIQNRMAFDLFYGAPAFKANILVSKDHLAVWPIAIAIRKKFCCKAKLNRILSRFRSSGLYMKYLHDESIKILLAMSRDTYITNENRQLNLQDVSGAIMLLFLGYSLSFIALCGEIIYFRLNGLKVKRR
ncbi:Glutamate receptor ionotropic like protein [Argiope bruennichi]|uniref:Glutamate receptor ionotropic like protein n=1 Tax=Argiope bruennichi TaxID=94029 RepID=A0A8T0EQL9_ARGBR|nr:Glutamate receptor ionotropic like protein [Argiope bruennichi]